MGRQKEFLYDGIDLADLRDALTQVVHDEGLGFVLEQLARCRGTDGHRIGLRGIHEATTDALRENGEPIEDPHKDQCDKLRQAMRAFLELE